MQNKAERMFYFYVLFLHIGEKRLPECVKRAGNR